ncbi:MAG: hypothetical protein R2844_10520 [Caldilineales bacterium]
MGPYGIDLFSTLFLDTASGPRIPVALEHWPPLVRHFGARCNRFRADCWARDAALLDVFRPYADDESPPGANPAIIVGRLSPELLEIILREPFDSDGGVKWFTLMLMQDDEISLSSAHNGAEIRLTGVSDEEMAWVRSILPDDVRITSWTAETFAEVFGGPPIVSRSNDQECRLVQEGEPDLRSLSSMVVEVLVQALSNSTAVADNDKALD